MKRKFGLFMLSAMMLASLHAINAMERDNKDYNNRTLEKEKSHSRSDGRPFPHTSKTASTDSLQKKKVHTNNASSPNFTELLKIVGIEPGPTLVTTEIKVIEPQGSSSNPHSPHSPHRSSVTGASPRKSSPRPEHHVLVVFGQDHLPILKINIGNLGTDCQKSFCDTLRLYNVQVIVYADGDDANDLDKDCNYRLTEMLKELKIVDTIVHPQTVDEFINITCKYLNKTISVHGLSKNGMLYTMLVCAALPKIVEKAISINESFTIHDNKITIKDVLLLRVGLDQLVEHLLQRVYKRVFVSDSKHECNPNDYLNAKEKELIKNFCIEEILKYKTILKELY